MFPCDTSCGASGRNIYNCRCRMRTVEKDGIEAEPRQMRVRDPVTGKNVLVNEMTYSEWIEWKKAEIKQNETATFTKQSGGDILREKLSIGAGKEVNYVCDLDPNIYKAVTPDIASHQVIITDKQLVHIRERHPDIAPDVLWHLSEAVMSPDYIIETDMPNTANILKKLTVNGRGYQVVLRLKTSQDPAEYCDSIITFMSVNEKRWRQYLRNRKILYSRE